MKKLNLSILTTAMLACGFSATAEQNETVNTPFQVQAPQNKQQNDQDYYDDGEDFAASSHGSEQAWGWSSAKKDEHKSVTGESSSSDEPPPPPPTGLDGAEYITYSPFTILGNNKIAWAAINGLGSSVTYTLQQQKNNGSWGTIYTGYSTSRNLSNLTDGVYKYRVKGCTSSLCSPYVEYVHAQVKNNPYNRTASVSSKKGDEQQAIQRTNDFTVPKLGYGFDMTRGEPLSSHCWNVASDSQILGSTTTAISKELVYSVANTSEELATQLDLQTDIDVSAEYGGYSAEYKYTKQLFSKTRTEKDSSVIVAKLKDTRTQEVAKTEPTISLSTFALDQLRNNENNFRNDCGDKYIDRVTMGRYAYVTIKVTSESKSKEEIETTTNQLKLDLKIAEGSYNNTTAQQLSTKYQGYNLDIYTTMIGSGAEVVQLTDITQLVNFLGDFETDTTSTLYPVGFSQKYYNVPSEYGSQPHFSVFTDYRAYTQLLSSWTSLDRQVAERCYYFDRNSSVITDSQVSQFEQAYGLVGNQTLVGLCATAKRIISDNITQCATHQNWQNCVAPINSQCQDSWTGTQCMATMTQLPVWNTEVKTSDLWVRAPGGCWSDKDYEGSVEVCLSPDSLVDFTKKWTVSDHTSLEVDGLGNTQYSALRVKKVTHTPTEKNGNQQCVVSYAKAWCDGKFGGGPGGWYGSNQWLHGIAPSYQGYYF